MAEIYVGGPVLGREGELPEWVRDAYGQLARAGLRLPYAEPELERSRPQAFFQQILTRIRESGAAIVIFTGGDVSGAIEATMASSQNKPVLLMTENQRSVPRLLIGLPLLRVVEANDQEAVLTFLREYR
ncbi:MAG: hypothetical protein SFV54_17720 [Bryobacteraceae bacterium]|nr:hypothetical protein [Bryobacteraceae bacterium]